jgi:hypothetical protein
VGCTDDGFQAVGQISLTGRDGNLFLALHSANGRSSKVCEQPGQSAAASLTDTDIVAGKIHF